MATGDGSSHVRPMGVGDRRRSTPRFVSRPRYIAGLSAALTAPAVGRSIASTWAIYWNNLADGALPKHLLRRRRTSCIASDAWHDAITLAPVAGHRSRRSRFAMSRPRSGKT